MKANVLPLFVVSSLIIAIENAHPVVQAAQPMPIGRYPAITALPRNPQPVDHWERQGISISVSESEAGKTTTTTTEATSSSIETTSSDPPTTTSSTSDPPTTTSSSSSSSSIVRSSSSSSPSLTGIVSTASNGGVTTVIQTVTNSGTATSSSASASSTDASDNDSGVGGKSIAGIVVVAVLVVVGIGGFIYWKLSKKRFSGLEDTDDNFKWPDLQDNTTAMQPLPGRAESVRGAATDASHSEHGKPYFDNQSAMSSVADLSRGPVEPAGAYYDNPPAHPNYGHGAYGTAGDNASGYYDPYSGPVPEAFSPQATTGPSFAAEQGRQSPGPHAAYDAYGQRAASPGPNAAYARAGSPGPNVAYGGARAASPGPNMAYGAPRAASPGPNAAYRTASPAPGYAPYGGRAASPGPNNAYGGRASPGPNMAYGGRTSPGPNNAYGGHQF